MSEKQFAQRHSLSEEQLALAKMLGMGQLELGAFSAGEFQKEMGYQGVEERSGDRKRNLIGGIVKGALSFLPLLFSERSMKTDIRRLDASWHRASTGTRTATRDRASCGAVSWRTK